MGEAVFLSDTAREIGALQGAWQSRVLAERIARTLRRADTTSQTETLRMRAENFARVLAKFCPHWLEESEAMAHEIGAESWQLLALNSLPPGFWAREYSPPPLQQSALSDEVDVYEAQGIEAGLGGECTAFFALGEATLAGETLLHKNRDERDEVQCVFIKKVDDKFRFVGAADIGNFGAAHVHSENLWAGANNTGSKVMAGEYADCALSDSHALRFFAENCRDLDDIPEACETLASSGALGGGGFECGSIFLLADSSRALIIEATSRRMAHRFFSGDEAEARTNHFLFEEMREYSQAPVIGSETRLERARELLGSADGTLNIPLCREIARDRKNAPHALCRNVEDGLDSVTVSTATATISSHDDRRCSTHFHDGHPRFCPVVIASPLDSVSDSDLLSGAHNQRSRALRDTNS